MVAGLYAILILPLFLDSHQQSPEHNNGKKADDKKASTPAKLQVSGSVQNSDGAPLDHVEVTISGPIQTKKTTSGAGAFSFEGPAGAYIITAKTAAGATGVLKINVSKDKTDLTPIVIHKQ